MKKILFLTVFGLFACGLHAQITTDEAPYSWGLPAGQITKGEVVVLPAPNIDSIMAADLNEDQWNGPLRFAYPVKANFTLENSGVWTSLNDGSKIWQLRVKLPGAESTNTMYDKFWLPNGAKFFVYSEDTKQYIGAITSQYIGGSRDEPIQFATALIFGENVVFEYYQPASVTESAVIYIPRIDYGYRYVHSPYENSTSDTLETVPLTSATKYAISQAASSKIIVLTEVDAAHPSLASKQLSYALFYQGTGVMAANGQIAAQGGVLDFSRLPAGVYLLQIQVDKDAMDIHRILLK
ncbi:MAG: hypothetical protein LBQ65_05430 [Tannerellaceae bacterium]|jgi:hypothetical protein|nr:hypothetical protein [Tannerellaceae bacterium]